MRILNIKDAESDLRLHFRYWFEDAKGSEKSPLFRNWLLKVWLPNLTVKGSEWMFPIYVKEFPSLMKGLQGKPQLFVDLPSGPLQVYGKDEWDIKDARAGTLFFYQSAKVTFAKYSEDLSTLRDYLEQSLFRDKPDTYDVRKHAVAAVTKASAEWHVAEEARRQRERAKREAEQRQLQVHFGTDMDIIGEFDAGKPSVAYIIVKLKTQNALTIEGDRMHHCIGSYGHRLEDGFTQLLSIRKASAPKDPILTTEIIVDKNPVGARLMRNIVQIRAPYNAGAETVIPGIADKLQSMLPTLFPDVPVKPKPPVVQDGLVFKVRL